MKDAREVKKFRRKHSNGRDNFGTNLPPWTRQNRSRVPPICLRCGSLDQEKRDCKAESILSHVRGPIENGTPLINVVADLVQGLELEQKEERKAVETSKEETSWNDEIEHADNQDNVLLTFDESTSSSTDQIEFSGS